MKKAKLFLRWKDVIDAWNAGSRTIKELHTATGRWYPAIYQVLQAAKRRGFITDTLSSEPAAKSEEPQTHADRKENNGQ